MGPVVLSDTPILHQPSALGPVALPGLGRLPVCGVSPEEPQALGACPSQHRGCSMGAPCRSPSSKSPRDTQALDQASRGQREQPLVPPFPDARRAAHTHTSKETACPAASGHRDPCGRPPCTVSNRCPQPHSRDQPCRPGPAQAPGSADAERKAWLAQGTWACSWDAPTLPSGLAATSLSLPQRPRGEVQPCPKHSLAQEFNTCQLLSAAGQATRAAHRHQILP